MKYKEIKGEWESKNVFKFNNFLVEKKSSLYWSVCDKYGYEITSSSSKSQALKKAKLLQIGYKYRIDEMEEWY